MEEEMVTIVFNETISGIHVAKHRVNQILDMLNNPNLASSIAKEDALSFAQLLGSVMLCAAEIEKLVVQTQELEELLREVSYDAEELTQQENNAVLQIALSNTDIANRICTATDLLQQSISELLAINQVINSIDYVLLDECFVKAGLSTGMPDHFREIFFGAIDDIDRETDERVVEAFRILSTEIDNASVALEQMIGSFEYYYDDDDYDDDDY